MERKPAAMASSALPLLFFFAVLSILLWTCTHGEATPERDIKITDTRASFHLPLGEGALFGPGSLAFCLGLRFHGESGDLYFADAYLGLMRVGSDGGEAETLATEADGAPFKFANGVDVDQVTGEVYFTDSSATYQRRDNEQITLKGDATGRLMKFDPRTRRVAVLRSGLPYPNGVAVSGDRTHLLVSHTSRCQVWRHWLSGPRSGAYELFADVPGYPDNVMPDGSGGYWVGLYCEKAHAPVPGRLVGVRLGGGGGPALEVLTATAGVTLSEVVERGGVLWLGSVELAYVGVLSYDTSRICNATNAESAAARR